MKKVSVKINTNKEKIIIVSALSAALAIIFDQKNKKPQKRKNFFQRASKHYKRIDKIITKTVAKDVAKNEAIKAANKGIKSEKLRNMNIESSIPFELKLEDTNDD